MVTKLYLFLGLGQPHFVYPNNGVASLSLSEILLQGSSRILKQGGLDGLVSMYMMRKDACL
jgi:hypothetical protein